jgi:TolB-like protein
VSPPDSSSPADRWRRVEDLFSSLVEHPREERRAALERVEDPDLRAEVATLLDVHEELATNDGGFLASLDSTRASEILQGLRVEEGAAIGRYRIVRRLGRGGMGVVYQAHDPRLDRSVALKLLPPSLSADPVAVRHLTAEARAASALDHPNIETVYEIGETVDDRVFIAMAYYEGETLRQRIARGPMTVDEVVDLGVQLADGLSAAHRGGIIHRDIKPENLLLTGDGVLKIVDFGIATLAGDGPTSVGMTPGTAAYMSPEQTRGEGIDQRTDLWSVGVVLYEMLVGSRPFGGQGEALVHTIRNDAPRPLREIRPELPPGLAAVVERCLEKSPERRFESAGALAAELRNAAGRPATRAAVFGPRPRRRASWLAGAAVFAALALVALQTRAGREVAAPDLLEAAPAVAVLPFEAKGPGPDIWREGMVDLLSTNLDGVAGLRAIDSRTVLAHWRQGGHGADAPDLERALDVARRTGARYAVIGSVVSSGSRMRLGAQIYSLEDESSLASLQVEGSPDSLFALVDRLSIDVLAAIWQGNELPPGEVDLTRITTTSLPALKAFLEGESLLRRAEFDSAIAAYERAVAADSTFAFASYHLALAYTWMPESGTGDYFRLRGESFQRALRHADRLPEREALLLRAAVAYHTPTQAVTAIELLRGATRKYPDDADAWFLLGETSFHAGEQALVTQGESDHALRKAVELDPGFALSYVHLVNNAFIYQPDSARAAYLIDAYYRLAPNKMYDHENQIAFGLVFGDSAHRRKAIAALDTLPTGRLAWLADGYLDHPRFWAEREAVLERHPRPAAPPGRLMTFSLFDTSLSQGKLRAALAHLEDPLMWAGLREAGYYRVHSAGLPVSGEVLDRALARLPPDDLPADISSLLIAFYAGAYAADQRRWGDHAAAAARLRGYADRLLAEGDSLSSRFTRGAILALEGYGHWRRGEAHRALPILVDGQRQAIWSGSVSREALNDTIRWWLGELLLEMGRPQDAALYFESFWNDSLAADQLARIYERMGDQPKAREAYALVAFAWKDADPELQPRVRAARAAVQRLTRSGRE